MRFSQQATSNSSINDTATHLSQERQTSPKQLSRVVGSLLLLGLLHSAIAFGSGLAMAFTIDLVEDGRVGIDVRRAGK